MPTWQAESADSAAELLRTLRENVDPLPTFGLFRVPGKSPFLGLVWNDTFEIRRRSELMGKNDFGAIFRGTVRATPTGSLIAGTIGAQSMLKVFAWIFSIMGICILVAGAAIACFTSGPGRFVGLFVALGFLVLGPTMCGLFLLPSAWDKPRLIREIERVLNVRLQTV